MAHKHSVYDTDSHFIIDGVTRAVKNASQTKTMLVQNDHNSERFTFEIDKRYIDGHDLSLCNKVQVHYINIDSQTAKTESPLVYTGVCEVDDIQVSPEDENTVICSWLISRGATRLVGSLNFMIRFSCVSDDGIVEYAWNTLPHTGVFVSAGINADESFEEDYSDVIERWKESVMAELKNDLEHVADEVTADFVYNVRKEMTDFSERWNAKVDNLTAMRGTGQTRYQFEDGDISGSLISNGAYAKVHLDIYFDSFPAKTARKYNLPLLFAPLYDVQFKPLSEQYNLDALIYKDTNEDGSEIVGLEVFNPHDGTDITNTGLVFQTDYPLSTLYVSELEDIRHGANGETYSTAGNAVREQIADIDIFNAPAFTEGQKAKARQNIGAAQQDKFGIIIKGSDSSEASIELYNEETETGHKNSYLRFLGYSDGPVRLNSIAPGTEDSDAATVGQVKEMVKESGGGSDPVPDYSVYFDIDDDGLVSLKPEYRADGAKNSELPEKIIIPDVINGTAVTALQEAMFDGNKRVKSITIPGLVTTIPKKFANNAINLVEINGTENVEVIGQAAFQKSAIKKALFPNLKSLEGAAQFNSSPNLAIVDIGNFVTSIPTGCFHCCESLSAVRGGASVTAIGEKSFDWTRSLKNLPIVANVRSMGAHAFECSRVQFDWWTFKATSGCTFIPDKDGVYNTTPAHFNPSKWWENCTHTACENPLGSVFSQENPEWAGDQIPNSSDTYEFGCLETSTAHIYSALKGVVLDSPKRFVEEIVGGINNGELFVPTGKNTNTGETYYLYEDMAVWLNALDLNAEFLSGGWNNENLKKVYAALADGALVLTSINPGHAGVIYGVTEGGEMMVLDSSSYQRNLNNFIPVKYKMKIQNLTIKGGGVVIVNK